jgi:hypothetical protein
MIMKKNFGHQQVLYVYFRFYYIKNKTRISFESIGLDLSFKYYYINMDFNRFSSYLYVHINN